VFFCYVALAALGLGPAGAVIYRMAELTARFWARENRKVGSGEHEGLSELSQRLFSVLDHVPARMTAFGFAVVGNFEEAVAGWRRDAPLWRRANEGIILSAAAGAVGVQLGGAAAPGVLPDRAPLLTPGAENESAEAMGSTPGAPPELAHLGSVVGLVWRSMVLWMLLLALLKLANLLG
jgi:adenosylcobinamide-phosphate synthase